VADVARITATKVRPPQTGGLFQWRLFQGRPEKWLGSVGLLIAWSVVLTEFFKPPFEFFLFGNQPRGENLIDVLVEGPQLVDGHLLKLLPAFTNVQSPAPHESRRVAANLTPGQVIAVLAGPTRLPS
jgi:hypothetical protein